MGVGHDGESGVTLPQIRADVVVIGGGLAGISAAIELAEAGRGVTVLEARPWLGGATCSFGRRGLTIDNGQHAFLRCHTAYRDLLARLGVTSSCSIQDRLQLTVLADAPGGRAILRRSALPAPLNLARALARYQLLSRAERAKVGAAAVALRFAGVAGRDDRSFGDWLATHGQDERARTMIWDWLCAAALNVTPAHADLQLAASAIKAAVLTGRGTADIGLSTVPLSRLHGGPAAALLGRLGVTIRLGTRAVAVQPGAAGGYQIIVAAGDADPGGDPGPALESAGEICCDGVVIAVPARCAAALAPPALAGEAARWSRLAVSPVVSLHVIYARRVTRLPFAAVAGAPVCWVIDKSSAAGLHGGQYLAASVPAADEYVGMPAGRLRERLLPTLERLFPAAADTNVEDFFVTRERRATIRHEPGSQRLRPAPAAGLPGLAVAGAWTDTGWPDTMEGAVRSGRLAAQKLIAQRAGEPGATTVPGPARSSAPAATSGASR